MRATLPLPKLRFDITESAEILGICRALLYKRIESGAIKACKDGRRTFITAAELERYVSACADSSAQGVRA